MMFVTQIMAWIVSCLYEPPEGYNNPYRIIPIREEHENYKRYERQMYNDSLRNKKRKN